MAKQIQVIFVVLLSCVPTIQAICFLNITSVECQPSKQFCSNSICNYTLVDQFSMAVNEIGCTLLQDISMPKLKIKHEIKIGVNKYGPGMFNLQLDVCEMAAGMSVPVLNMFVPKTVIDGILHRCPYKKQEKPVLRGFTFNSKNIPVVHQVGEYRMTFAIKRGRFAETFVVKVYGHRCVNTI